MNICESNLKNTEFFRFLKNEMKKKKLMIF